MRDIALVAHVLHTSIMPLTTRNNFSDNQPRVKDWDIALALGYRNPKDIRHIIRNLFGGKYMETTPDTVGGPGRPGVIYWKH